ncbi:MAG: sulfatase [Planctomycetales bacterium]|nr:sulfatase [Planctomycetales bacterium]
MNYTANIKTQWRVCYSLGVLACLWIGGNSFVSSVAAEENSRPNILFILSDDHALEAIGAYGSWLKDVVQTPTIDRLANEGMRFENMCVNNSICSPSRASILTGQYSHRNGVLNLNGSINENSPMFSEELQRAGYQTAVFGKWHLKSDPRGFDTWAITRGQGNYFDPNLETPNGLQKLNGYYADRYTDLSLEWLAQRDKSKPFALSVHFKGPHHPYDYPERHATLLEGVHIPEPPTLHEDVVSTSPRLKAQLPQQLSRNNSYYERHKNDRVPKMDPANDDSESQAKAAYQHMLHKYIRCVAAIDENIHRLLDQLAAEGIMDDTLVVYSSDQGYWLGQHGLYDKRLILEESLKMPLIVRYPKSIAAGTVDRHLCSNVDFAPTLLEFAGVPIPATMQGKSLWPLLRGESPTDWRQAIWYAYWAGPPHWGIRTTNHTLVCFPGTNEVEFYDLLQDPLQQRSMQEDLKSIEMITSLMEQTMQEVGISNQELPQKNNRPRRAAEN